MEKVKRKVYIQTSLIQSFGSDQYYEVEEVAKGVLITSPGNSAFIFYESFIKDEKVTTTVKINNQSLSLIRIGEVYSRQIFIKEQWNTCYHCLSGNSLILKSFTKRLEHLFEKDGGSLNLLYDLWTGNSLLGHFCLDLVVF